MPQKSINSVISIESDPIDLPLTYIDMTFLSQQNMPCAWSLSIDSFLVLKIILWHWRDFQCFLTKF